MQEFDSIRSFLAREEAIYDESIIQSALAGKRVLITGAAGFIGSALALSVSRHFVDRLLLLDVAESGLHDLSLELDRNSGAAHQEIVGDVCDSALLHEIFFLYRPQIVLHAAACKHVPLMEKNPFAAAKTNVLGTERVAAVASASGVDDLILVSTDKAVDPASVMGATKRLAELIVLTNRSATRMKAVRLGNVWRSTGSVVPVLQRQIAQGGPVTITDAACTRYFLSIQEAVQRVLFALLFEQPSAIFVSEVLRDYSMVDLAEFLLDQASVDRRGIDIRYIGLRSGEKISECMRAKDEHLMGPAAYGMQEVLCNLGPSPNLLATALEEINAAVCRRDLSRLLQAILSVIPAYTPGADILQQASVTSIASSTA
jgi:FlaA1/EpsC-like NDP-sugar epimerase